MNPEVIRQDPEMPYIPPSRWPVTFGITSIVFGVIGLLSSLLQIAQYVMYSSGFMSKIMTASATGPDKGANEMVEEMFGSMAEMAPRIIASQSVLAVLALVLLVGGILLLMRRRVANWTIQVWAVLKFIAAGFAVYLNWQMMTQMQSGMFAKISAGGPAGAPSPMETVNVIYIVFYVIYFIWLAALPVFFLVWLNREPIKDDLKDGVWK